MRSESLIVLLAPQDVAMFRFLLEAEDNLAICATIDRALCALKVIFPPGNKDAALAFLENIQDLAPCELLKKLPKKSSFTGE